MTTLAAHPRLTWVCGACGGPRVPGAPGKNAALAQARLAQAAAFGWSAGAIALALTFALTTGLGALFWGASHGVGGVFLALGALMAFFAWRASARAATRRGDADDAVKEGWREAARALVRSGGAEVTATTLAHAMRISEGEADELLTRVTSEDEATAAASANDVRFRVRPLEPLAARSAEDQREIAEAEARLYVDSDGADAAKRSRS